MRIRTMFVGVDAALSPHAAPAKSHDLGKLQMPPNLRRGGVSLLRRVGGCYVFMKRCGKPVIAQWADRGVRPYRTLYGVADRVCNFVIASRRGERGIDPYGIFARSPHIVRFCVCVLRGRGKPRPYVTTKRESPTERGSLEKQTPACKARRGLFTIGTISRVL